MDTRLASAPDPDMDTRTTLVDAWQGRSTRRAAGKRLRQATRRQAHAEWQPPHDGRDAVAILQAQGTSRIRDLLPIRYGRMRASPLAFLRGAAAVMAHDLAGTPTTGLQAQSCGDCHLANFGSYASPERLPVFDINDFDETLPAPFEWDVKRLAASLVVAGREKGLPERACRALASNAALAYRQEVRRLSGLSPLEAWNTRVDLRDAINRIADPGARERARARLDDQLRSESTQYGLLDTSGPTPRLREKPPLVLRLPAHEHATRQAFARYLRTLAPERRVLLDRYRLEDVVFKVVGIGSVGTFCAIGLFLTPDGEPLLLQIKEAQASVLEPFAGASPYRDHGERVTVGQRIMQAAPDIFLNWTRAGGLDQTPGEEMAASGRHFYVRRLKDARLAAFAVQIEQGGLADYARLCGRTLGRAHGRSAELGMLAGYLGKGRSFDHAVAEFAAAYADQTERDWRSFQEAIDTGRLEAASV